MESRIERLCIERGLKMTGQRRIIARVLSDAEDFWRREGYRMATRGRHNCDCFVKSLAPAPASPLSGSHNSCS